MTQLLLAWSAGSQASLGKLLPLVYSELRWIARGALRGERHAQTLQPTVLVHEAYLRLVDQQRVRWQGRKHFYGIAARLMRQILVDHARSSRALKRGGDKKVALAEGKAGSDNTPRIDLIALDRALERLDAFDSRQRQIVELRFFAGLTVQETAAVVGVSKATVKREWSMAKAWLYGQLERVVP
ncbi:MAG: sigma-70 family RNA polymerase sigma factor [Acidobacteriota bacterium]